MSGSAVETQLSETDAETIRAMTETIRRVETGLRAIKQELADLREDIQVVEDA
jgi:hypothetical protein